MLDERLILALLYVITYPVAMVIQVRDPETNTTWQDWLLSFFANLIGAFMIWNIVREVTSNVGIRQMATIFGSLFTYRVFRIMLSVSSQQDAAEGFKDTFFKLMKRIFNPDNKENN